MGPIRTTFSLLFRIVNCVGTCWLFVLFHHDRQLKNACQVTDLIRCMHHDFNSFLAAELVWGKLWQRDIGLDFRGDRQ